MYAVRLKQNVVTSADHAASLTKTSWNRLMVTEIYAHKKIVYKEIERTKQKDKGVDGHDGKYVFLMNQILVQFTKKPPKHLFI